MICDYLDVESFLVVCKRCGRYSESNLKGLKGECKERFQSKFSQGAWSLLASGRHPKSSMKARPRLSLPIPAAQLLKEGGAT